MQPTDLQEVKSDLKEIRKDMGEIKETLAANTASLQLHMKRTDLNEVRIAHIEKWLLGLLTAILITVLTKRIF